MIPVYNRVIKRVKVKRKQLLAQNSKALVMGQKGIIQNNCCILKGIDYVMELIKEEQLNESRE